MADNSFYRGMIGPYANMAQNMPENGTQVVIFGHTDPEAWRQLADALRSAGLFPVNCHYVAVESGNGGLSKGKNRVLGAQTIVLKKGPAGEGVDVEAAVRTNLETVDACPGSFTAKDCEIAEKSTRILMNTAAEEAALQSIAMAHRRSSTDADA